MTIKQRLLIWRGEVGLWLLGVGAYWCYLPYIEKLDADGQLVVVLSSVKILDHTIKVQQQ